MILEHKFNDPKLERMAEIANDLGAEMSSGARYSLPVVCNSLANGALGADLLYTIPAAPGGYIYLQTQELISVHAGLVTSATAANRQPALSIADATGHSIHLTPYAAAQAASLTWFYTWAINMPFVAQTLAQVMGPIPPELILSAGMTIATVTSGLQAGDQWKSITVTTRQVP